DNRVQGGAVPSDDLEEHRAPYLPCPILSTAEHARRSADWVGAGGALISEGCPGDFGDRGWVGTRQPNHGLDEVFGAVEESVLFTPDLLTELELEVAGDRIRGGVFRQSYRVTDGTACGWYDDGSVAAVDHRHG